MANVSEWARARRGIGHRRQQRLGDVAASAAKLRLLSSHTNLEAIRPNRQYGVTREKLSSLILHQIRLSLAIHKPIIIFALQTIGDDGDGRSESCSCSSTRPESRCWLSAPALALSTCHLPCHVDVHPRGPSEPSVGRRSRPQSRTDAGFTPRARPHGAEMLAASAIAHTGRGKVGVHARPQWSVFLTKSLGGSNYSLDILTRVSYDIYLYP